MQIEPTVFSMPDYTTFVESIADDVKLFKEKQARGVEIEEARYALHHMGTVTGTKYYTMIYREIELLAKWNRERHRAQEETDPASDNSEGIVDLLRL